MYERFCHPQRDARKPKAKRGRGRPRKGAKGKGSKGGKGAGGKSQANPRKGLKVNSGIPSWASVARRASTNDSQPPASSSTQPPASSSNEAPRQ